MTDETDLPKRPNANYKLSKQGIEINPEEELNFHYNRERRLAKAPQNVRDLYNNKPGPRFSLLRPLVADRPRRIIFFTIVVLCLVIFVFSFLGLFGRTYSLDGNNLAITGTGYDGVTIIVIRKNNESRMTAYTGAVDITVSPVLTVPGEDFPVFFHRIFFTLEQEEVYRFTVPFDAPELLVLIQTERSSLNLRITPN
jgi:hypothetical protein